MRRSTFDQIVATLAEETLRLDRRIPAANAFVDMRMRVAMTLAYLAQEGGLQATAALFGVSKATVLTNINEVRCAMI